MEAFEGRLEKVNAMITTIRANRDRLVDAVSQDTDLHIRTVKD